jgi:N-acetylneuraminic acid mutarotase
MVVWGSLTGTGGIYDANTDSWTATDTTCAPTGRLGVSAIWTGERMIVWGGWANNYFFGDGYEFDPVVNSWTKLSNITAPSACFDHTAIWTGTQMIIWAGYDEAYLNTGGILTP